MTKTSQNYDNLIHSFGRYFGLFNCLIAALLMLDVNFYSSTLFINKLLNADHTAHFQQTTAATWMLIWYALASTSIVYCAGQALGGNGIGRKVYPAAYAAYVLTLLMTFRWLAEPLN